MVPSLKMAAHYNKLTSLGNAKKIESRRVANSTLSGCFCTVNGSFSCYSAWYNHTETLNESQEAGMGRQSCETKV